MNHYEAQFKLGILLPQRRLAKLRKPGKLPLENIKGFKVRIAEKHYAPQVKKNVAKLGRQYFLCWVMKERLKNNRKHANDKDTVRDFMEVHALTEDDIPIESLLKIYKRHKKQIYDQAKVQARIYTKHNEQYWGQFWLYQLFAKQKAAN